MWSPGALSAPGSASREDLPKRLTVTTDGLSARAIIGSHCLRDPEQPESPPLCEDKAGEPGTRRKLPIRPRHLVTLATGADASRVFIELSKAGGGRLLASGRATAVGRSARRWTFRLPRRLRRASLLEVYVTYPAYGSAPFSLSVAGARSCR